MSVRPSVYQPSGDPYDAVKEEVHRFESDGSTVLFRRVPIHRDPVDGIPGGRRYGKAQVLLGHPGEQRRYMAEVDGRHVGWVLRRGGAGRQPYVPVALFSSYVPGLGRNGHPELEGRGSGAVPTCLYDLCDLAPRFVEWRRAGMALTWEEIVEADGRRARSEEAKRIEAERRRRDDDLRREAEIGSREQGRRDTVCGLEEILSRYDGKLTNYQVEALQKAISHFTATGIQWHEQEFLDRMSRERSREGA